LDSGYSEDRIKFREGREGFVIGIL
jgi:hypothetical protein